MELVYPPVITLARAVFRLQGLRFTLRGTEFVPREGGAVMAFNHVGYMDFTYGGLAALPSKRYVRFMAKREVFDNRIAGPLMRGMHHINVDRTAGAGSYRAALAALKAGEIVGVFPEGTVGRTFEVGPFKSGAVRMARDAGVPLLPAAIWGSQRVWTKDHPKRLGRHRYPIHVYVGEPLVVPKGGDVEAGAAELRRRMVTLLHEAQEAYEDSPASPEDAWWLPARLGGSAPAAASVDEA